MGSGRLQYNHPAEDTLVVVLTGSWKLSEALPSAEEVKRRAGYFSRINRIVFDCRLLAEWDSSLLIFMAQLKELCKQQQTIIDDSGLPQGAKRLMTLAAAVPEKKDTRRMEGRVSFLLHVGNETVDFFRSMGDMLSFVGDTVLTLGRLLHGRIRFRKADLWLMVETCGAQALPIVSLISFLVGMILAFIGAIQLQLFGAQIYVADLVGIAMVRLMAAIMTGIIMAGRTGGAIAAQIGTMQVNQEIDALKTLGISPMEFLVLPRLLAVTFMMPFLCLYANLMGILGGLVVGVGLLDIGLVQYYRQTAAAVNLWNLGIGLFSGTVYGVIVALAGCMRGMQCARSASAVGDAATSAVVTAIVGIIVSTAIITVLCNILGI